MTKRDRTDRGFTPRGLRREDAAAWVGFSPTKFDELVKAGLMPRGKLVRGCRVWDRFLLDTAFEDLPDEDASPEPAPTPAADQWARFQ
jgi:hypothetical protein